MRVIECARVNAVVEENQLAKAPERDDQAEEEEQMVGPFEDVQESEPHEAEEHVVPLGIEPDEAGVAGKVEGADRAVRLDEAEHVQNR